MAQEYKVTRVSQEKPREWAGPNGTVYYIKVMLEGHEKPVSIGKKKPDALKVGDTVYGNILVEQSYPEDKFKNEQNPNRGGGGYSAGGSSPKREYHPRDDDAIRAQWAIGQANLTYTTRLTNGLQVTADENDYIEAQAKAFYAMVDRVKGSNSGSQGNGDITLMVPPQATNEAPNPAPAAASKPAREWDNLGKVEEVFDITDEPINLDDIPF